MKQCCLTVGEAQVTKVYPMVSYTQPEAVEHHLQAAAHHHVAAHHHMEAAHHHEQGEHEQAETHTASAKAHGDKAQKVSAAIREPSPAR
jgi:hypothetical protein